MVNSFRLIDKGQWVIFSMSEDNEIFQATGVKDKDGNMIFEGDYINLEKFDIGYEEEKEDFLDVDVVREVVFDGGCFRVVSLWDDQQFCNLDMINPALTKIVGNVKKTPLTSDRIQEI
jgi:uncharacterized phage protein (TIGR01671 family)